jgi:hypothetical protein
MAEISRRSMLAAALAPDAGARRAIAELQARAQPSGWPGFSIVELAPGASLELRWSEARLEGPAALRVSVGADDREARPLRAKLARSGGDLGAFDIRYACEFEPFDLGLGARAAEAAQKEGVRLALDGGTKPLWLLVPLTRRAPGLAPQLWQAGRLPPEQEFIARMDSLDSLQQPTWMEGCVLEGLGDLGLHAASREHLEFYFNESGRAKEMFGVENTLPVAALARWKPEHPAVAQAIAYWRRMTRADKTMGHGDSTVAETNYTACYPMAVVSRFVEDEWLAEQAAGQLRAARERLVYDGKLWLRHYTDGRRTFPNWCRGVCWYSLGMTRAAIELSGRAPVDDLKREVARVLEFARAYQREDGLYSCFLAQPAIAPDTSGSAGIAAAMALAARHGLARGELRNSAAATWRGLVRRLTADGFLTGVSQSNKREAGEALQRSDYRVTLQFGMGLMAQLKAALDGPVRGA